MCKMKSSEIQHDCSKEKCRRCRQVIGDFYTAIPEGKIESDTFQFETCEDCGRGCRLTITIDGEKRLYECCNCANPFKKQ